MNTFAQIADLYHLIPQQVKETTLQKRGKVSESKNFEILLGQLLSNCYNPATIEASDNGGAPLIGELTLGKNQALVTSHESNDCDRGAESDPVWYLISAGSFNSAEGIDSPVKTRALSATSQELREQFRILLMPIWKRENKASVVQENSIFNLGCAEIEKSYLCRSDSNDFSDKADPLNDFLSTNALIDRETMSLILDSVKTEHLAGSSEKIPLEVPVLLTVDRDMLFYLKERLGNELYIVGSEEPIAITKRSNSESVPVPDRLILEMTSKQTDNLHTKMALFKHGNLLIADSLGLTEEITEGSAGDLKKGRDKNGSTTNPITQTKVLKEDKREILDVLEGFKAEEAEQQSKKQHYQVRIKGEIFSEEGVLNPAKNIWVKRSYGVAAAQSSQTIVHNLQEMANEMAAKIRIAIREGRSELTMYLQPEQLGKLEIKVRLEKQKITAKLAVETVDAKQIIESNLNQLKKSLAQQGLRIEKFDVFVGQHSPQSERRKDTKRSLGKHKFLVHRIDPPKASSMDVTKTLNRYNLYGTFELMV